MNVLCLLQDLSSKHKKSIEKALQGFLKDGEKFNLSYKVRSFLARNERLSERMNE